MCGLVGVASSRLVEDDIKYLKSALICDTLRGEDSTGIAIVGGKDPFIYKRALGGYPFIQTKPYRNMEAEARKFNKPIAMLGHNRFATMGGIETKTAHPFRHNHITGMHNGTLDEHEHLADGAGLRFEVDSEAIIYALSVEADPVTVLEDLPGAFALSWHNHRDNTIHLARNADRPLCVACSKDNTTLVWASEEEMLVWLLNRTYKTKTFTYEPLPAGEIWSFDLDAKGPLLATKGVVEFEPTARRGWYSGWSGGAGYNNYSKVYDGNRKFPNNVILAPSHSTINTDLSMEDTGVKGGDTALVQLTAYNYYNGSLWSTSGMACGFLVNDHSVKIEVTMDDTMFYVNKVLRVSIPQHYSERGIKKFLKCYSPTNITYPALTGPKEKKLLPALIHTALGTVDYQIFDRLIKDGCSWCSGPISITEAPACEVWEGECPAVICPDCVNDRPFEKEVQLDS